MEGLKNCDLKMTNGWKLNKVFLGVDERRRSLDFIDFSWKTEDFLRRLRRRNSCITSLRFR
jgi:hypothetical protein